MIACTPSPSPSAIARSIRTTSTTRIPRIWPLGCHKHCEDDLKTIPEEDCQAASFHCHRDHRNVWICMCLFCVSIIYIYIYCNYVYFIYVCKSTQGCTGCSCGSHLKPLEGSSSFYFEVQDFYGPLGGDLLKQFMEAPLASVEQEAEPPPCLLMAETS